MRNRYLYIIYFLLLFAVVLVRDYTPDNELKYISIANEAIDNGSYFAFYNHGEAYADKPPLFFWLIMATMGCSGGFPMGIIGLFSLLPAIGILMVMDAWMRRFRIEYSQPVANMMLLTTVMFLAGALVVRMDMLMSFFIVLSLYTFFKLYKNKGRQRDKWLLPVWIFLAIFTKGPMGFIIPLLSMAVFLLLDRNLRHFGRYMGWRQWAILVGLCAVWFLMVYIEGGKDYLNNILFKQTVGRGIDSFHHKEPVWFYFPRMLWSFAPWILLYLVAIFKGLAKRLLADDTLKFFLVVIVANIVMLSLVSSKIDIYMLPIYPFVAYLAAALLAAYKPGKVEKICVGIPAVIFMALLPASFFLSDMIPYGLAGTFALILPLVCLFIGGVVGFVCLFREDGLKKAVVSVALGMLVMVGTGSIAVSRVNEYIGLRVVAQEAERFVSGIGDVEYGYYMRDDLADMDVYLDRKLVPIYDIDSLSAVAGGEQKMLVFVREKDILRRDELKNWIDDRKSDLQIGDYRMYLLGGVDKHSDLLPAESASE